MFLLIAGLLLLFMFAYALLLCRCVFVIAYHGVGFENCDIPGLVIKPDAFRRQVRLLSALGFRCTAVDSVLEEIRNRKPRWRPRLSITFDDGYRNIRTHALPLLQSLGWPATIFVPTAHVGGWNQWDEPNKAPRMELLDWTELGQLAEQGTNIGSHGKAHRSLIDLSPAEASLEVSQSLGALQSRLPASSRVFSYPYGHRSAELAPLLEAAGYRGACSLVAGALPSRDELFDVGRLLVRDNSIALFLFDLARYPVASLGRNLLRRFRAT